jgi:hypothetical protein
VDPRWLFPLLALVFAAAALWRAARSPSGARGAARTWGWMALLFGLVSLWLHFGPR